MKWILSLTAALWLLPSTGAACAKDGMKESSSASATGTFTTTSSTSFSSGSGGRGMATTGTVRTLPSANGGGVKLDEATFNVGGQADPNRPYDTSIR